MKNKSFVESKIAQDVKKFIKMLVIDSLLINDQILQIKTSKTNEFIDQIVIASLGDLMALCAKDPASRNIDSFAIDGHQSFKAVMHYRVANGFYYWQDLDAAVRIKLAKIIAEKAKIQTGVEIHPAAKIGKNFVIDHGLGTIIGETCEIGDDCYILSGVILGSKRISDNPSGKRHPTIGNNVHIGSFARIFGPVIIGNNVFVAPHSIITSDIPADTKVLIINQLQLVSNNQESLAAG
jgi:serine O-acetyltransferase